MRTKAADPTMAKPSQVKRTAAERIRDLVPLALDRLERALSDDEESVLVAELFTPEELQDARRRIFERKV
ncbi:MAG: hypothetical protein IIB03_09200 [Acidobacteria bacterium]|nr:hypothetical protein [Acidobacteriota bacterium]